MDFEVFINDHSVNDQQGNIIIDCISPGDVDKTSHQSPNENKISNFLSSRMEFMDEEFSERDDRKSLILLSRQYPSYRHYSRRTAKMNQFRFMNKYRILPEIKGQTLFGCDRDRCNESEENANLNVSSANFNTLQQLQSSILRYGSSDEHVWVGFTGQKYAHKLVRPGFSARRYLANLARNLNETLVKKLMSEGYILEKNLFTSNSVMPHIRRRLSYDLSRYPEPYRILKQMLMATGPLNEFSFIWGRNDILRDDGLLDESHEMGTGDIRILLKKNSGEEGADEFEEVLYSELSGQKKKTILSNLLVKSAMNHALQIKEQMMEFNGLPPKKMTRGHVPNIHIPVLKFDMKKAITELLTQETLQTLSTNQMEIPFIEEVVKDRFKGKALRGSHFRRIPPSESETLPEEFQRTSVVEGELHHDIALDEEEHGSILPPHLTLRLNQAVPSKLKRKKIVQKPESTNGRESEPSDQASRVLIKASDGGLKSLCANDRESQGQMFAEMIKKKAELAAARKENIQPYGKYKDPKNRRFNPNSATIGDIDPTVSFSNWKYKEDHIQSIVTEAGHLTKGDATGISGHNIDQPRQNHDRLVNILRGQADLVAEEVLGRTEGGQDFASDVNVAIKSIIDQTQDSEKQIWSLDVEDIQDQADYQGVIKDIFKTIFKDELHNLGGEEVEVSPTLMKLLQSGFNLKLEDIEMVPDPITGKMMAVLKKGVHIPEDEVDSLDAHMLSSGKVTATERDDNNEGCYLGYEGYIEGARSESHRSIPSSIYPFNTTPSVAESASGIRKSMLAMANSKETPTTSRPDQESTTERVISLTGVSDNITNDFQYGQYPDNKTTPSKISTVSQEGGQYSAIVQSPTGEIFSMNEFVQQNNLVEKDGLLYDTEGGHFNKDGQYQDMNGNSIPSKSMKVEHVAMTPEQRVTSGYVSTFGISVDDGNVRSKDGGTNHMVVPEEQYNSLGADIIAKDQPPSSDDKKLEAVYGTVSKPSDTTRSTNQGKTALPNKTAKNKDSTKSKKIGNQSKLLKSSKKETDKGAKTSTKDKKGKKKEFIFGRSDETKDIMKLYNRGEPSMAVSTKSVKSSIEKKTEKTLKEEKPEEEAEEDIPSIVEKEDSGDIRFMNDSNEGSQIVGLGGAKASRTTVDDLSDYEIDEETFTGDGGEARRLKMLKRQERLAQRKADIQRKRDEEDLKRKRDEEERLLDAQRLSLEEALRLKLEEERKRKEEEFLLQKAKEKEEEQALLDAERRKEFFRLRQIEKERQQREEYARRREEAKIRQALEERLKREEQEKRDREEAEMLAKLNEEERKEYLKRKAELEEQQRLEEERERLLKEEQARLALEEAKLLAQKQAMEKKLQEERVRRKIEDEGLKKYLNITPAFIWSYFEFVNLLGVNDDPSIPRLQTTNRK